MSDYITAIAAATIERLVARGCTVTSGSIELDFYVTTTTGNKYRIRFLEEVIEIYIIASGDVEHLKYYLPDYLDNVDRIIV